MEEMERKIDEVHFMLSHLMKSKPQITGLDVAEYLGIGSLGFMDIIIDDGNRFPKAISVKGSSIFECEWWFESVSSWKKRNSDTLAQYKKDTGDIHERIVESYRKVKDNY